MPDRTCPPAALAAAVCVVVLGGCAAQELKVDEVYGGYYLPNSADSAPPKQLARAKAKAKLADRALLETLPEPDCGTQMSPDRPQAGSAGTQLTTQSLPAGDANADLALRIKLEYERECYRQAEARMRDRLKQLQATKAARGADRTAQ